MVSRSMKNGLQAEQVIDTDLSELSHECVLCWLVLTASPGPELESGVG